MMKKMDKESLFSLMTVKIKKKQYKKEAHNIGNNNFN